MAPRTFTRAQRTPIVQGMVAAEAATSPGPWPPWIGGLPTPAAAASTFVAPPAPTSSPPPPETAPASASPAPADFGAGPASVSPAPTDFEAGPASASSAPADFATGPAEDVPDAAPSAAEPSDAAFAPEPVPETTSMPSEPPLLDLPPSPGDAVNIDPTRSDTGSDPAAPRHRPLAEVVGRALVMNAVLNLHFRAPVEVVRRWVEAHGVAEHLSPRERALLARPNADVTAEERAELRGYLEGLWALLWAGGVADELRPDRPVPADMATLVPSLKKNEDASMLSGRMTLRPAAELAAMRDRYQQRYEAIMYDLSAPDHITRVEQRRKALLWVLDPAADWDTMVTTARRP